jgi:hypothetical protein
MHRRRVIGTTEAWTAWAFEVAVARRSDVPERVGKFSVDTAKGRLVFG